MKKSINHLYLIVLLAILSAIAPVSIATYLPAMPSMAIHFDSNIDKIELSLSIFLIGFAIGQIFGGIVSDRMGRKKSSLMGLFGFALFSFIIIFSHSVYELWFYRFCEAFFGGFIVVNGTATVRDIFKGKEAAKVFSLLGTVRSLAPLFSPAIGAAIIHFYSWKAIFIFLTLYALSVAFFIIKDFEETFTYTKRSIIESYTSVFTHLKAMLMIFVLALSFSGMFSLVSKASFIYIQYYKLSTDAFPFYYGLNYVGLMLMAGLNVKFLRYFSQVNIVKTAILIQIIAGILFALNHANMSLPLAMLFIGIFISMNGLIYGNCTALILENFSTNAGVASSVAGVIQFGLASFISSLVVLFHGQTLLPIGIGMFLIATAALIMLHFYIKK
ncbi:MAG: multidrug effflux MFS transporter [Sulfurospirillaceae bacterium]|nr:multidrug effflux MFS transporter [Sulfurospirillaceae bacterium]MDD2827044.1 multidrug effflux MFS transporter [Sulfurospirillaceae bacterium]